jgi:multiple sugar transport system substrate-binding protein
MIPAKTSGDKLKATIKFLQWMSVASNIQTWIDETGAVPALVDGKAASQATSLSTGVWAETDIMGGAPDGPPGQTGLALYEGYLLGSKSLAQEQAFLADGWKKGAMQNVKTYDWGNEAWAKSAK